MKHVVFLGDGMADYPVPELGEKTPLEASEHPAMDEIAKHGILGLTKTVPQGMAAGSDVANIAVLGFDPAACYTGRSPLEAVSMGVALKEDDMAFRCNLVTLSGDLDSGIMEDYSAGEISNEEAVELIRVMQDHFDGEKCHFYPGISYRHCLVLHGAEDAGACTPPHDILGKPAFEHLPKGSNRELMLEMIRYSNEVFPNHPVNLGRVARGLRPANSVWFWGGGRRPAMEKFENKYGVKGAVVAAVDLLKGIGLAAGMEAPVVPGATGGLHTDFAAKGRAAIQALSEGCDFVYIHVESPDECGHQGLPKEKVWSIGEFDRFVVAPVMEWLKGCGEPYSVLLMPDHPTPVALRTHVADPIPFAMLCSEALKEHPNRRFTEACAKQTGCFVPAAHTLMGTLIAGQLPE